ncbi:hypothetical protein HDU82_001688 [Entophlyctis luteolus]|nr:hypothetical protein HDU82_001688 [Entophlyctis luteolus]
MSYVAVAAAAAAAILVVATAARVLARLANPPVRVDWAREIVVVTGGSQGLGLAFVQRLLRTHAPKHVVILSLYPPASGTLDAAADKVTYVECDVSNFAAVKAAAESIAHKVSLVFCISTKMHRFAHLARQIGIPTMLVNNAGILGGKKFIDLEPEIIEKVIQVNLLGTMWTTKVFLPNMLEANHGHILNVSSLLGMGGSAGVAEYCASKFGVSGFTEAMIQETKNTRVKVSAIYPGLIATQLFNGVSYRFPLLFPKLSPASVADTMIGILAAGKSSEVVTPSIGNLGRAMKLAPVSVQNVIKDADMALEE